MSFFLNCYVWLNSVRFHAQPKVSRWAKSAYMTSPHANYIRGAIGLDTGPATLKQFSLSGRRRGDQFLKEPIVEFKWSATQTFVGHSCTPMIQLSNLSTLITDEGLGYA